MVKTKKATNESITFRLGSTVLERLSTQAERQNTSINVLVNQVLSDFVEWDATAINAGWAIIPKNDLKAIINRLNDDDLVKIAKDSAIRTRDIRLLMTDKNDLDAFLFILRYRCKKSDFHYKEMRSERGIKIIVQHDMGRNWSLYSKTLYEEIINDVGHRVQMEHTDNTLMLDIAI